MSEVISTGPITTHSVSAPAPETSVEVFAVYGVEPEIQAYAMAKYSRSSLSMKESLKEITQQKAEKFLNTFYFQYGHRSIADLAHIATGHRASFHLAPSSLPTSSAGTARSDPLATRTSGRAVTAHPVSRMTLRPGLSIAKPSSHCSRPTTKFRSGRSNISPASQPGPLK